MFKEKIIAISDNRVLTNKGRIFVQYIDSQGYPFWSLVESPDLNDKLEGKIQRGKTDFIEPISPKEKFDKANNISDLL